MGENGVSSLAKLLGEAESERRGPARVHERKRNRKLPWHCDPARTRFPCSNQQDAGVTRLGLMMGRCGWLEMVNHGVFEVPIQQPSLGTTSGCSPPPPYSVHAGLDAIFNPISSPRHFGLSLPLAISSLEHWVEVNCHHSALYLGYPALRPVSLLLP